MDRRYSQSWRERRFVTMNKNLTDFIFVKKSYRLALIDFAIATLAKCPLAQSSRKQITKKKKNPDLKIGGITT